MTTLPNWFVNAVGEKVEKLEYIDYCKGLSNILVEYKHGRLHGLKSLSVIGPHDDLKELINAKQWIQRKEAVFQKLRELHLIRLDHLKQLCVGELPLGSLSNLKSLQVESCRKLANALLPSTLMQSLQNLEKVICIELLHIEYVFGCVGLEAEQIVLTKLRELKLRSSWALRNIWNGPVPHAIFQNLQILEVSGCMELKNLFTFDVAQCLFQLEDLSIEDCPRLNRVIEPSEEIWKNKIIVFPQLKSLVLRNLTRLTSFYSSSGNTTIDIECPPLKYLRVWHCPHFSASAFDFLRNTKTPL